MKDRLAVSLRSLSVRRGDRWVLRDITWQLRPGERWALLGHNGAGKTQLLKLLSGDVWPTPPRGQAAREEPARIFRIGRRSIDLLDAKQRIAYIGGERQDKYARYGWNLSVRDVVATGLHRTDLLLAPITGAESKRVNAMLRACGLRALATRAFLSLSYGEKRLALLARALVQDPDWLLLDEFYNGLDVHYRRRIDEVLNAARRRGQSWIATAHRAMDVPRGTRFLIELSDGRIHIVKRLKREDTERLSTSASEHRHAARRGLSMKKTVKRSSPVLLRLTHVDLYVEYRAVLRDLNWELRRGEHWSIFGANGAGKSSFLKLLYGDLSPALGGKVERAGFPRGTPIFEWKRLVGYVSPELQSTYSVDVSILELIASGRHSSIGLVDPPTAADMKATRAWLKFFKLLSVAKCRPRELSYGQLRRALIARAMAADPLILLLDEPLTGLDPKQRALMKRLLERLMQRRLTLIAAVHHPEDLPRGMTHALHLHNRHARLTDPYSAT
ncbi:MAG: ATP-binding cassette domain-containing protein [Pseudomonadota bacterium]|nr:ATP-binding cassette domain-containing protein [Pseudomonadota bacterium]